MAMLRNLVILAKSLVILTIGVAGAAVADTLLLEARHSTPPVMEQGFSLRQVLHHPGRRGG